jgi:hypothetical protein
MLISIKLVENSMNFYMVAKLKYFAGRRKIEAFENRSFRSIKNHRFLTDFSGHRTKLANTLCLQHQKPKIFDSSVGFFHEFNVTIF